MILSLCQRNLAANTGMNDYDFFIFIVRFALANLALHNLTNDGDVSHSPSKAHNIIANLLSICEVASRMGSAEAFAEENLKRSSAIEKIAEEPDFVKLCMEISRTFETIEEGQGPIFSNHRKLEVIVGCGSMICTPEDLVEVIDRAILNHRILCKGCNVSFQLEFCNGEVLGIEGMVL